MTHCLFRRVSRKISTCIQSYIIQSDSVDSADRCSGRSPKNTSSYKITLFIIELIFSRRTLLRRNTAHGARFRVSSKGVAFVPHSSSHNRRLRRRDGDRARPTVLSSAAPSCARRSISINKLFIDNSRKCRIGLSRNSSITSRSLPSGYTQHRRDDHGVVTGQVSAPEERHAAH